MLHFTKLQEGTTPLMFAVACCNYNCVQELLEQGADPNSRRFEVQFTARLYTFTIFYNLSHFLSHQTQASCTFFAAQNGDIDTLRLLLKYGAIWDLVNLVISSI
jgi:ankyrin repeat protein